jgi:hypothetical protein
MRRGTPRRSEQNQLLDEEIGKIPEQLQQNQSLDEKIGKIPEQLQKTPSDSQYIGNRKGPTIRNIRLT